MVTTRLAARATALAAALLAVVAVRQLDAHPLHTTLTEVADDPAAGGLRITIRAFVDDFAKAAAKRAGIAVGPDHAIPDAAMASYVASTVRALEASGTSLPLRWAGSRRQGDVIWLTVLATRPRAAEGLRVRNAMLFDLYDDQVNIVQSNVGGKRESKLYTKER